MSYLRISTNTRAASQQTHFTLRFNNRVWHALNTRTYEVIAAHADQREALRLAQQGPCHR